MATKTCNQCEKELSLESFHRDRTSSDGRQGKCKDCKRTVNAKYAQEHAAYFQTYQKERSLNPEVAKGRKEYLRGYRTTYSKTEQAKRLKYENTKRARLAHPEHAAAREAVRRAIKSGRLTKQPCHICGDEKVEAHHPDYSRPIDVVWLCRDHHEEVHQMPIHQPHVQGGTHAS